MLSLNNIEGTQYNPFIDNYLVIGVNNYADTDLTEIETLVDCVEQSHNEFVMVETQTHGMDLMQFLENIEKIVIFKVEQKIDSYYLTIQKSLLN